MQGYTVRYLIACTLLGASGLAQYGLTRRQPQAQVAAPDWAHTLPLSVGGWTGRDLVPDKEVADYLAADALLVRRYTREGRVLDVTAVFGTRWRALHSPAGCYPSQGWQIQERSEVEIAPGIPLPHPGPLHAEKLVVKQADRHLLVLYLYAHPGGTTANWVQQCLEVAKSGAASGGIVLIVNAEFTPQTESRAEADARELIGLLYPYLVKHWYEH